jgi:hypothetical protein
MIKNVTEALFKKMNNKGMWPQKRERVKKEMKISLSP